MKQGLEDLRKGFFLHAKGFVQLYRGKEWEIRLHRGVGLD